MVETPAARVAVTHQIGRLSLRARGDLAALNQTINLILPTQIGMCAKSATIEAACLGPDEWTLLIPLDQIQNVQDALAALYPSQPHSLVDVTGREISFHIEGPQAADLMSIGCPRDISTIKAGQARRTIFDGATVVLWREAQTSFRMDVWNSFAPFVAATLVTGAKELAAEHNEPVS